MQQDADILIVGGGPVGATLALALRDTGHAVTMLEAREQGASSQDQRALALSYGSRLILERLGVWSELAATATPIETIHISQRGSFGRSLLKAAEHNQPALGYVLSYGALSTVLNRALADMSNLRVVYGAQATAIDGTGDSAKVMFEHAGGTTALSASLAVVADGGRSLEDLPGLQRHNRDYGHAALVTKVECELAHGNIAYERFTPAGPVALLPNGKAFSLVWTATPEIAQQLCDLDEAEFLQRLHGHFGDRLGRFLSVGKRMTFPLKLSYLSPVTSPRLVVIGNAAQTMHPVAGQGFNIGLRDAWELADIVGSTAPEKIGGDAMLKSYQQGRQADTKGGILFTDFLVRLFSNDIGGLSALRAAGLGLLDLLPPAKRLLVGKMSFGARG